ncbi:50S ribosomal protein L24 [bacterium]|nr:50S ribosomal protein L24 [bacterium]|tara:strand:+ start:160 stop:465 length:306 start_codon:yes stop_codon:yes gene_type:complete
MNKFKKNDKIIVIKGKDKGKVSKITKVFPRLKMVLLDNCYFATKHLKPNQNQQGGIKQLSKKLHWSNIMHYDEKSKKGSRIKISLSKEKKVRVLKSCEIEI